MQRKLPDGGRKAWLREERDAVLSAAATLGPIPNAIVLWTYETASRITETLHARWADIDEHEKTVTIDRLKGSESELALPISDGLIVALKLLERVGDYIFPGRTRCTDTAPKKQNWEEIRQRREEFDYEIAADKCPEPGHISQRYAFQCFRRACAMVTGLHPGLHHPHVAKHTRLYDMAEDLHAMGLPAHEIFDWLKRLSGHKRYDNLAIYLRSRQGGAKVMENLRRGLERRS